MRRGFQLLGVLTLLPWLLGAECSPPAPCGGDADGDGLLDCAPEERAACLSLCVVLGQEGDPCVVDPCSVGPAGTVCATGYTCVAGQCEPANDLLWQACDPGILLGDSSYCSSGTYCADLQNCEDLDLPPWLDASALGVCLLPAREGERCMGNYADLQSGPVCSPCSPGLECLPAPWNGAIDVCQRGCTTDDDCPCDVVAQGNACTSGYCRICMRNGLRCEEGGAECCDLDPDTQCRSVSFFDPQSETYWRTDNFCCRPQGATCVQDADCCPNARCNGGTCEGCGSFPGAPPGDAGCCPGLVLRTAPGADPVCGLPCPNAQAGRTCRYADTLCGADQP
ncbi:MAG: hypothetical protein K8H88_34020, partial [Sandaracinaceae bacterium]|nr:hypothetical protein [Sandaracinaceae bacterium]